MLQCSVWLGAVLGLMALAGPAVAAPPPLAWGTYFGGSEKELYAELAPASDGGVFLLGWWASFTGIATPGTHQQHTLGKDVFVTRFDAAGQRVWGTYFGGESVDWLYAAVVDGEDFVYIAGATRSANGIATPGAFKESLNQMGNEEGFLAKFTTNGNLVWATYFGDTSSGVKSLAVDANHHVYFCGYVWNEVNDLASPDAHQPAGGGYEDGFVARFTETGERVWSTFYGGEAGDRCEAVRVDGDAVYIAGTTDSTMAITTPGTHKTEKGGSAEEAFLVRFDGAGVRDWGTYFGGDNFDRGNALAIDTYGAVYLGGGTLSNDLATLDAHQPTNLSGDGGRSSFLARFQSDGSLDWATYHGGLGTTDTNSVAVDAAGHVLLAGTTDADDHVSTADGFKPLKDGPADGFLASFDATGTLLWGTYIGGPAGDAVDALVTGPAGVIYVAGGTGSETQIATPGAYQTTLEGGCDVILIRFEYPGDVGDPCTIDADCPDQVCVDGVCCTNACGGSVGDCQACSVAAGAPVDGNCALLAQGVVCRPADQSCEDKPELCRGDSPECPPDDDDNILSCMPEDTGGESSGGDPGYTDDSTGDALHGDSDEPTSHGDDGAPGDNAGDPPADPVATDHTSGRGCRTGSSAPGTAMAPLCLLIGYTRRRRGAAKLRRRCSAAQRDSGPCANG